MVSNDEELERLRSLLEYGVNHNKEHQEEMKEWAETAKELDEPEVNDLLLKASDTLGQVTDYLDAATEKLGEDGG